jgi:hypothetical protein
VESRRVVRFNLLFAKILHALRRIHSFALVVEPVFDLFYGLLLVAVVPIGHSDFVESSDPVQPLETNS